MTKQKPIIQSIPSLYKRSAEDLIMYGYVLGMQKGIPTASTQKCIDMFMKEFNLSEEDYPRDSACVTFRRVRGEHDVL